MKARRGEIGQPRATPWVLPTEINQALKGRDNRYAALTWLNEMTTQPQGVYSPTRHPPLFPSASSLGWPVARLGAEDAAAVKSSIISPSVVMAWSFSTRRLAPNHSLANASRSAAGSKVEG